MDTRKNILEIKNMHTYFFTDNGVVKSVDGVDIELKEGSTLGIVGESGSGKSVTALSVMGLLMGTTGKVVEGQSLLDGRDITNLSAEERRKIRGNQISMIFQEPMTSLNPVMKIGDQLVEAIKMHQNKTKEEAQSMAVEMLKKTGLPRVERIVNEYPFQLSGGQRQRRHDRHGSCLQSEDPHCRRAHHSSRRDDSGSDYRPDEPPEKGNRNLHHVHYP